jgi:outer membrane protein
VRSALLVVVAVYLPSVCFSQQAVATVQQGRPVSLDEALTLAAAHSEEVAIARAGVTRSEAERVRSRADRFPQLSALVSYDRTLASEFSGLFTQSGTSGGTGNGTDGETPDLTRLPFGRSNIWRVNLSFTQNLLNGGRVAAQERMAREQGATAEIGVASAQAQLSLDVIRAYYDAVLADRMVGIAESAYQQAEAAYQQTRLQREAGTQPEFELLRAQVSRDNLRPTVIRQRAARQLAQLRLKQLLEVPGDEALVLTTPLDEDTLPVPAGFGPLLAKAETSVQQTTRAPVRQAERTVSVREAAVSVVRSQRWPTLNVTSSYGRVNYPSAFLPELTDFRTNWTIGAALQLPILTGGRLRGDELAARADLDEANARLRQVAQAAELDTQNAFEELDAAQATWEASSGTVQQAVRAYEIAELRYRQGISTQLELSDARLLLSESQANRAQAARDLQVARARVVLLPDLPLGTAATPGAGTAPPTQTTAPRQTPQQSPATSSPTMRAAQATSGSIIQ